MIIYCCCCEQDIKAVLTDGSEIYPHRKDLYDLPFWKCETCNNFVGCHHKTANRTQPLGCIPTKEIRNARNHIHRILDPVWQDGRFKRKKVYKMMSEKLGYKFHTANTKSIEECRAVYRIIKELF
jgi:hypothetical protein